MTNKSHGLILAFLWIIIAAVLIVYLVRLIPKSGFILNGKTISFSTQSLYKDYRFASTDITTLNTDVISESVHVSVSGTTDVLVELRGNGWDSNNECSVTLRNGILEIASARNVSFGFKGNRSVIIYVPSSLAESGRLTANLSSTSGSVHSNDVSYDTVQLHSTSGSVHLYGTTAKTITLNSTSGSTHFEGTCDELISHSTSGSVHANGTFRHFDCSSTSGSVHVEDEICPTRDCSAKAVSGSVHITLPEDSNFVLNYHSISSSVHNNFTGSKLKKSGTETVGSGGIQITASSNSGSVHINEG